MSAVLNELETIYEESANFSNPHTVRDTGFNQAITMTLIHKLFLRLREDPMACHNDLIRLYVDGKRKKRFGEEAFLDALPELGTDLNEWMEAHFAKQDFLIFINYSGSWNNEFASLFANLARPIINKYPPLSLTLETHLILGRYKSTPFGVHIDDENDRVIHFHISGEEKYLHLWQKDDFHKLTGSYDFMEDMEPIAEHKVTHPISPGSSFVLPAEYYHVGESPDISVVAALALSKISKKKLVTYVMDEAKSEITQRINSDVDFSHFDPEPILSDFENDTFYEGLTFKSVFLNALERYTCCRNSNLHFVERPLIEDNQSFGDDQVLTKKAPFNIDFCVQGERLYLYSRGHRFTVKAYPLIESLCAFIKDNDKFTLKTVMDNCEGLPAGIVRKIINWLVSTSGISVTEMRLA